MGSVGGHGIGHSVGVSWGGHYGECWGTWDRTQCGGELGGPLRGRVNCGVIGDKLRGHGVVGVCWGRCTWCPVVCSFSVQI